MALYQEFGEINGRQIGLYTLKNDGVSLSATNYGCAIQSLSVKGRKGQARDVVLGFDTLDGYVHQAYYFGTVIGRCCNRIRGAAFDLNGHRYELSANEGRHHLHGGVQGFHDIPWETITASERMVHFRYMSPDGEEGYPGNLEADVIYRLTPNNQLSIEYTAASDADTIVNMTNHSYFNLNGHDNGSIEDHELQIFADRYTEIDEECIPTGVIAPVDGTPLDFREPMRIADRLDSRHEQMGFGSGYNHNYMLKNECGDLSEAVTLVSPKTGIRMKVFTTEPGLQLYTGQYLKGDIKGKNGYPYGRYAGLCLETQGFPNAVQNDSFPSVILKKDMMYKSKTVLQFDTDVNT